MDIKVTGIDQVLAKLKDMPPRVQRKLLRSGLAKGARIVLRRAKELVPVDDGDLKKSGRVAGLEGAQALGFAGKSAPIGKRVVFDAPHAHIIEAGRKNASAQPFLGPALDEKQPQVFEVLGQSVDEAIREGK